RSGGNLLLDLHRFADRALVDTRPWRKHQYPAQRNYSKANRRESASALKAKAVDPLDKSSQERGGFVRDANNLVRRLAIEFEIELRLRSAVVPIAKEFQVGPQAPLRDCGATDGERERVRL